MSAFLSGRGDASGEVVRQDVLVLGTGVAGLATALGLAPRSVALVTKSGLNRGGSSVWAQGGIAAAVGPDDSPALHAEDTLRAAAGLAVADAVDVLTCDGPERIRRLLDLGVAFDRRADGKLALGREGAHSRRRILHANGDATGAEIVRGMVEAVERAPEVHVHEDTFVEDLLLDHGRVVGVVARKADGELLTILSRAVVLATGGIGQLYSHTTNPPEVTGDGLAMAARAGAHLIDLEFVQFHPTALHAGLDPMPLVTEALRGEGAILVDGAGRRFMPEIHPLAELAPRDIVARAIWARRQTGEPVFLDARKVVGEAFPERFPTVYRLCRASGIDPRREPIPVSPAVHYHMGGVATDQLGRTSLPGLWACGEVASTGVHGANRLASNSLLEGLVFGARIAESLRAKLPPAPPLRPPAAPAPPERRDGAEELVARGRELLWEKVGLIRDAEGLTGALAELDRLAERAGDVGGEARSFFQAARLVTSAALMREESRGGHFRRDFPESSAAWERRVPMVAGADARALPVPEEPLVRVAGGRA